MINVSNKLYQLGDLLDFAKTLEEEVERLEQSRYYHSTIMSDRVITSQKWDAGWDRVQTKIDRVRRRLRQTIMEYLDTYEEIMGYIDGLDDAREKRVLILKYVQQRPEQDILTEMGISKPTLYRINKNAIDHIEKTLCEKR